MNLRWKVQRKGDKKSCKEGLAALLQSVSVAGQGKEGEDRGKWEQPLWEEELLGRIGDGHKKKRLVMLKDNYLSECFRTQLCLN
jgi:hypothetical protein